MTGILPPPPPRLHQTKQSVPRSEHEGLAPPVPVREWRIAKRRERKIAAGGGDGTCFRSLQGLLASTPAELHARLPALLSMERARRICGYFSHTFSGQL